MCLELPLGYQAGRHPCDCGSDWAGDPEEKVLHEWRFVGNRSVLPCSSLSVNKLLNRYPQVESEAKAMTKGCIEALYVKPSVGTSDCETIQNCSLETQQLRQGYHATTWTRAQDKTLGGADVMGSAAGKDRCHLVEQSGYAGELCRCFDKTRCHELYSTR